MTIKLYYKSFNTNIKCSCTLFYEITEHKRISGITRMQLNWFGMDQNNKWVTGSWVFKSYQSVFPLIKINVHYQSFNTNNQCSRTLFYQMSEHKLLSDRTKIQLHE